MRIKKTMLALFLLTAIAGVSIGVYGFKKQSTKKYIPTFKIEQYKQDWNSIDSLIDLGLTESALKVAESIYKKAKAEKNSPQIIKAIMYRMRLNQAKQENVVQKSIDELNEEIKLATFPEKPLLQSMLADLYGQYYNNNRWKFAQRSQAVNIKLDDIATWDLKTLFDQIIKQHQLSLKNEELLKETTVDLFNDVVYGSNTDGRAMRATLYDFIAHRALDFFMTGEADVIRPAYKFELNSEDYFGDAQKFIQLNITTQDTLSTKFYAIDILKKLTAFHAKDKDPAAVVDVELKRLLFLKNYGTTGINDSLYIKALVALEKKHTDNKVSSVVSFEIANYYYSLSQKYDPRKSEQYKWDAKYAIDICDAAIKKYPESRGARNCKTLIAAINSKNIAFTLEQANIPNKPHLGYLTFKNVKKIYARAVKTTSDKLFYSQYYYYEQSSDVVLKSLLASKVEKEWSIDLPDDGDNQTHYTQIAIPELPEGIYAIVVSEQPNFVQEKNAIAFAVTQNTHIAYVQKRINSEGTLEFNVLNRLTGEAIKNVKATLYDFTYNYDKRKYQYKEHETYTTDSEGKFLVKADPNKSRSFNVRFTNNNDTYYTDGNFHVSNYGGYGNNQYTSGIMFTDRNIYRPGQTIYFKGIIMDYKGKAVKIKPNTYTMVYLRDANYQEIATQEVTTNDYGTYSGSFVLPTGVLTGQMTIADSYASNAFSVEEYKRPKFEVLSNPIKGTYRLGDTITITGIAKAFSGARIDGAQVKYRVVRTASFPYWWWFRCGYYPSSPQMEIVNGITTTNDTGAYKIKFKAIPDYSVSKKSAPTFNYQVYADVTDINGETHSTEITALVAYTSLNINVATAGMINAKTAEQVTINCTNTNGVVENANIEIAIHKLKEPQQILRARKWEKPDKFIIPLVEFNTRFPNDVYDDEDNKANWTKDKKLFSKNFDTSKDKIIKADVFNNLAVGEYVLEAFAKDKFGAEVKDIKYFTVYNDNQTTLPAITPSWFTVTKPEVEPGEKAALLIGSSEKNVKVLFCTEEDGKLGKQEWITLNNEQKLIEIPIEEKHRGGLGYHFIFINKNRMYSYDGMITVPYTNKQLDISFETFRNKLLPGEKEEWRLKIKDKKGDKLNAEMLATLYDASLDQFKGPNAWYMDLYGSNNYSSLTWSSNAFQNTKAVLLPYNWNPYSYSYYSLSYDQLNWFGYYLGYEYYRYHYDEERAEESDDRSSGSGRNKKPLARLANAPMTEGAKASTAGFDGNMRDEMKKEAAPENGSLNNTTQANAKNNKQNADLTQVKARTNFNETAFFYPQLQTDSSGSVIIKFTMPEALTKWRMMGLAHTKDLKVGQISNELITQKELMVIPNAPRFFRENDKMELSSKITNLSDKDQEGQIQLYLYDAISLTDITNKVCAANTQKNFTIKKGLSTAVNWELSIPEGFGAITYKVVAKAGSFSDGEEMTVPVLTNRMLVTETMPLNVRSNQTKTFNFEKFISQNNGSTTLRNHKLTLEFTANPAWYAIQALPYLMEYPYDCAEQTFSRYYANSIATHIANSSPKIKAVFENWKTQSPDALVSNLEKNQELKSVLLQETPWVMDAKDESERKKRVGLLFDLNRMANEQSTAMRKLQKMQLSNGGWPWFDGGPDDRYITQHIVTGIGHLQHLGIKQTEVENGMMKDAVRYLDDRIREDYEWLLKYKHNLDEDNIGYEQIQYLYARSYFKEISVEKKNKVAFEYYKGQAKKYWLSKGRYMQGMIALGLFRFDDKTTPAKIMRSIKENALVSEEMGMYWKENYEGYYWWHAPIETHSLLIEAFDEVSNDKKAVDDLRVWLLKSKQTQNWRTTKATTEACYALLLRGTNWLATESNVDITLGTTKINPKDLPGTKQEAGTGYFKTAWSGSDIKPEMGKVTVTKKDEGVSWGALYWQYFEQLDKITPSKTPLNIIKKLFVERNTASGPVIELIDATTKLKVGDKVKVRIELRVDRDMQYVHMKDMRASGFEPINVLSQYKWQDYLGYYESTGDAATNFFFSYLNKGTYVFEYPLRVSHNGDFSNGITSIQCMYAPEFTSNSEGIRVKIEK